LRNFIRPDDDKNKAKKRLQTEVSGLSARRAGAWRGDEPVPASKLNTRLPPTPISAAPHGCDVAKALPGRVALRVTQTRYA
jgi:hypothetical protein